MLLARKSPIHTILMLVTVAVYVGGFAYAADKTGSPTVRLAGLRIVAEPYAGEDDMRAFLMFPSTTVALLVEYPVGGLISLDDDKCELKAFTDDQDTNLLVEREYVSSGFSNWPKPSPDGKAVLVEVTAGGIPAAKAKSLRVQGQLVFKQSTGHESAKQAEVALKKDTTFSVGPYQFKVKSAEKPGWGDAAWEVEFETKQNIDAIREVKFYDSAGKLIESERGSRSHIGFMGQMTYSVSYQLKQKLDTATIEISYWKDIKDLKIPLDLNISVGMQ